MINKVFTIIRIYFFYQFKNAIITLKIISVQQFYIAHVDTGVERDDCKVTESSGDA